MDSDHRDVDFFRQAAWHTYTTADGLAGLQVEAVAQDAEGFLWFATDHGGASRFDGEEFTTFTRRDGLPGDQVYSLLRDGRNRLWFGTLDGGACWYDGRVFHGFADSPLGRGKVTCLFEDREERIWFGGPRTLYCLDGTRARDLLPELRRQCEHAPSYCWGMAQDREGDLWFGTERLIRFDGERFHAYGPEHGLPEPNPCYAVGRDADGGLWVGGRGRLVRCDGADFRVVLEGDFAGTRRIRGDREGRLWCCTAGHEIYWFDGTDFHSMEARGALGYSITDLLQDREGVLWFATWGFGVSCCDPRSMRRLRWGGAGILEDREGRIWTGAWNSLACVDPQTGALVRRVEREGHNYPLLEDRAGRLWIGGTRGLRWWDGEKLIREGQEAGLDRVEVTAMALDPQGYLLLGHDDPTGSELRITRYDGRSFETLFSGEKSLENCITRIVVTRDAALWFGLGGWHGSIGDGGIGRLHDDGTVTRYRVEDGLADDRVTDLLEDRRGRLWVTTRGGVSCFDGERFTRFTTREGLPVDGVLCGFEDDRGHLWFGTESGVIHSDGQLFQLVRLPCTGAVRRIVQDRDGHLWFPVDTGLVRYVPGRVAPRVRLQRVTADRTYEDADIADISTSAAPITFEFKGLSFHTPPGDMLYACRLVGFDADWRPPTRRRRAVYADLPPAEYTFEVKAVDRDLNESEPARVRVTVILDPRIQALSEASTSAGSIGDFVGNSPALQRMQTQLAEVAGTDLTVLITGETGTGKGLAARSLHALSARKDGPFIQVNCGAIPDSLVESELFGHEKGSFTGAVSRKLGKVELARGGTLFLDEIGDMALEAQVKLLHLLEERTFERVGGTETLVIDVRMIAATNRDLEQMVEDGSFREDLYYRLQAFPVRLPPLRERREDVLLLALYFMERMAAHLSKKVTGIEPEALSVLQSYSWPGNVRELEHAVQRAVVVCREPTVRRSDIPLESERSQAAAAEDMVSLEEVERRHIEAVLERTGGVIRGEHGAAAILGLHPSTLYSRMKKLGIERR